ncbi:MAG: insulinase family protein [Acidobacteriota bacterium]|nr:insulinase family protein [Acidobacteriota bacterium]
MKFTLFFLALIMTFSVLTTTAQTRKVFPYPYQVDDLPNGLRVVTVPTDYPNLVALYTVVGAGSRNEIEDKKSGYAHFFEHLMFRGSENYPAGRFDEVMQKAGASSNAYTSDDRTVYHETFAKEDLEGILKLEADRFQHLKFPEEKFKTEAGAVLGEYNKNSASPFFKMNEVLRETAFRTHTYSHTTMGYIADIRDYPNQYAYAFQFFNRFYRPENTTIIVVGDINQASVLTMIKKYYGDWKRGDYKQTIPVEPAQTEARSKHIEWASQTLPIVQVAYRAPAFSETAKDKAALDLLGIIAFGGNSEIFQKLVRNEQKATFIGAEAENHIDPELFNVVAQIKDVKDSDYVQGEIVKTYQRYTTELIPQKQLDETRSLLRYGFSLGMNSNDAIAGTLAEYVSLRRSPDTIDKVFALYDSITPEDIKAMAAKYFTAKNQTIITLATKQGETK